MIDAIAIFNHHIYEYKKGLRRMVLYTGCSTERETIISRLENCDISFHITEVNKKVNCFFGDNACIEVIKTFADKPLYSLNDYEDFILGALLGYDLRQQCERYLGNVNATWVKSKDI